MTRFFALALLITATLAPGVAPATDTAAPPDSLEVTYLANAGFLVRVGEDAVMIDAFVASPYLDYASIPYPVQAAMIESEPPFDDVDVVLVSHGHGDHHQRDIARAWLAKRPDVVFESSEGIMKSTPIPDREETGVTPPGPAPGESEIREYDGIRVEFFGLAHTGTSHKNVPNLGHLIELKGRRVLHLGDAAEDDELFAALDFPSRNIDVAIIPYWYLRSSESWAWTRERVGASRYVLCHVPPKDVETIAARLRQAAPDVVLPQESMETHRF